MSLLVKTSFKLLTTNANQLARLLLCQQQSPEALSRTTLRRTAWVSSFKRKLACCTYAFRCLGCVIWSKGLRNVRLLGRFSLLSMNWATEVGVTSASLASSGWASIWRFRRQPFFFRPHSDSNAWFAAAPSWNPSFSKTLQWYTPSFVVAAHSLPLLLPPPLASGHQQPAAGGCTFCTCACAAITITTTRGFPLYY